LFGYLKDISTDFLIGMIIDRCKTVDSKFNIFHPKFQNTLGLNRKIKRLWIERAWIKIKVSLAIAKFQDKQ
jgi:hypothetical protein